MMNRVRSLLVVLGLTSALVACNDRPPAATASQKDHAGAMSSDSMPMATKGANDGATARPVAATGSGVVTAIDRSAGTITIRHGPIDALKWPAMTMAFKTNPATLLDQVKVGDNISFDMTAQGNEVTAVRVQ